MITSILVLAAIGFCVALYAYIVESKIKKDSTYKPACDITDRISCTKALNSKYANLFFVSNGIAGMLYYLLVGVLAYLNMHQYLFILTGAGVLMTCFMAFLLYVKVKSYCLVCTSIYVINVLLFVLALTV